jgi:hypothetical protein
LFLHLKSLLASNIITAPLGLTINKLAFFLTSLQILNLHQTQFLSEQISK